MFPPLKARASFQELLGILHAAVHAEATRRGCAYVPRRQRAGRVPSETMELLCMDREGGNPVLFERARPGKTRNQVGDAFATQSFFFTLVDRNGAH